MIRSEENLSDIIISKSDSIWPLWIYISKLQPCNTPCTINLSINPAFFLRLFQGIFHTATLQWSLDFPTTRLPELSSPWSQMVLYKREEQAGYPGRSQTARMFHHSKPPVKAGQQYRLILQRQVLPTQHIIPNGYFPRNKMIPDALVNAFIMPADDEHIFFKRKLVSYSLV